MSKEMLYGLNDKPPLLTSVFVALQHLLAVFGGIVTAPLIIALGMGLSVQDTSYFVSSSLVISGLATLIQINRIGPVGSGLLSIQGTSFTFIGPIISAYFMFVEARSPEEALGIIFGTCAVCAVCVGLLGQFIEKIQAVITPNVTGATVMLIGISLVWTTIKNLNREISSVSDAGGQAWLVAGLAVLVFGLTFLLSRNKNPFVRILSVTAGLLVGSIIAYFLGMLPLEKLNGLNTWFLPQFNRFPIAFDLSLFVVLMPIFIISSVETIGDLTATSKLSGLQLASKEYWKRIRGGISGDALNSLIASMFCTFPNTSFSQNNGVIRLTGVSSRYVGRFTAVFLCVLGLFPIIGGLFIIIPGGVLYGATMLMFIMVFFSGVAIVKGTDASDTSRWWIVGFAVVFGWCFPLLLSYVSGVPAWLASIFSFPISTGAVTAILIELVRNMRGTKSLVSAESSSDLT